MTAARNSFCGVGFRGRNRWRKSTYARALDFQQRGQFFELVREVADADRAMMRGPVRAPFLDKTPRSAREAITTLCIADFNNSSRNGSSFAYHQFQSPSDCSPH